MSRAWYFIMHMEHGWLARHQNATLAIAISLAILAPGAIEWMH